VEPTASDEKLSMRIIDNFISQAGETPRGEFWREEKDRMNLLEGTQIEKEKSLPYHDIYVYSAEFLTSVMLLVYEVLSHTIIQLPTFLAVGCQTDPGSTRAKTNRP
jgi:hypothetical protein